MGKLDDIRPLAPTPSSASIGEQRRYRKQRKYKPVNRTRRQPDDSRASTDTDTSHIDEYA